MPRARNGGVIFQCFASHGLGLFVGSVVLFAGSMPLGAQDAGSPSSKESDTPAADGVGRARRAVTKLFSQPLHPVVQTIASGGGLGGGIGYDFPTSNRWRVATKAVVTPRGYWLAQFDGGYRSGRGQAGVYARSRSMNHLNYFGSGDETELDDRTMFTLREPTAGLIGSIETASNVVVGGRLEAMWPRVVRGRSSEVPSIEQLFGDADAPGLAAQPRFARYQAFVQATPAAGAGWTRNRGGTYRVTYDIYDDRDLGRFDFDRLQIEGRHGFAALRPDHVLTLRGWVSSATARSGRSVPFFLQHTLGGTSNLRSLHDDPIGGDGTAGTLRGFQNLRFRDNHLLLLQAEYRFDVWGPVDATVFVDAGKAVHRRGDLSFGGLKHDYGFSVSLMRGTATMGRVDVGVGGEGTRVFLGLGGLLP